MKISELQKILEHYKNKWNSKTLKLEKVKQNEFKPFNKENYGKIYSKRP